MKLGVFNQSLFIEIRPGSLNLDNGGESLTLPLERAASGRLTESCKQKVIAALQGFLKKNNAQLWIQHDFTANAKLKKAPAYYEWVDELPRNPLGKILKNELREKHGAPTPAAAN